MEATVDWQIGKSLPDRMKYMLHNQLMCDVTFHVGSDKSPIKAHKYMLASTSPVFYNMFVGPLAGKNDVEITDISPEHFSMLLEYIYTDAVIIDFMNVKGLIYGSEKYMIQNLKELCYKFLSSIVNTDHACIVFQTAHDFYNEDLKMKALDLIFKNGRKCLESTDFLHLSAECLKFIVESDNLNCDEGIIYQRMIQWAKLRCGEQNIPSDESIRNSLGDLLYLIRFPCMEPWFFTDKVASNNILTFEERVKVYEQFNHKQTNIFLSKRRLGETIRVLRCKVDVDNTSYNSSESVDFIASNNAELSAILILGSKKYLGSPDIKITVLCGHSVLSTMQTNPDLAKSQVIHDLTLESPVKICANTRYTVQLNLNVMSTFKGKDIIPTVTTQCKNRCDFVVTFFQKNETQVLIPGLVFDL